MNEFTKGQIDKYCESVIAGCKPVAMFPIQDRYIEESIKIINENYNGSLLSHTEFLYKDWTTVWIYKKPFMIEIIKSLSEKPKTIFDHWVLGKAFGYSDEAIEEFIKIKGREEINK